MRHLALAAVAMVLTCLAGGCTIKVEEAKYSLVTQVGRFEIRDYPAHAVAETVVTASLEGAGNRAFYPLFRYITGENHSRSKVAMTAPVSQEAAHEKIAMTAPVSQQSANGGWVVSFTMPASYTLESLPTPNDPSVTLRLVPPCRMAAVRYSGGWSEKRYCRFKGDLDAWITTQGLKILGEPVWARYNPPFTLWFLRRNEILIPVSVVPK